MGKTPSSESLSPTSCSPQRILPTQLAPKEFLYPLSALSHDLQFARVTLHKLGYLSLVHHPIESHGMGQEHNYEVEKHEIHYEGSR